LQKKTDEVQVDASAVSVLAEKLMEVLEQKKKG